MTPNEQQPNTSIEPLADTARLGQLLELRDVLGALGAERRSHRLPDSWWIAHQLYMVEEEIRDRWPSVHADRFNTWVRRDDERLHHSDVLDDNCGICRAIAQLPDLGERMPRAA